MSGSESSINSQPQSGLWRHAGAGDEVLLLVFLLFPLLRHPLAHSGSGRHASLPPGRTFLSGEVGVVTWLVGLVGGDTVMLVEVAVVLLLTDAEGLFLSAGEEKMFQMKPHTTQKPSFFPLTG